MKVDLRALILYRGGGGDAEVMKKLYKMPNNLENQLMMIQNIKKFHKKIAPNKSKLNSRQIIYKTLNEKNK